MYANFIMPLEIVFLFRSKNYGDRVITRIIHSHQSAIVFYHYATCEDFKHRKSKIN